MFDDDNDVNDIFSYKPKWYILDDEHNIIPIDSVLEWEKYYEKKHWIVKQEYVGRYWVSTVFLGLDHNWSPGETPVLFETMIFRESAMGRLLGYEDKFNDWQERYCTWNEAVEGHKKVVQLVKQSEGRILLCLLWILRQFCGSGIKFMKLISSIREKTNGLLILKKYKKILKASLTKQH